MKFILAGFFLLCCPILVTAQVQPDRVLVLTKPTSDVIDTVYTEFVQEVDLAIPDKTLIACLLTHLSYCRSSSVDLVTSLPGSPTNGVLADLRKAGVCGLDPLEVKQALERARFSIGALSDVGWTIVAQCGSRRVVLEIPDSVDINEKRLNHASKRVAALFAFVRKWTAGHASELQACPIEWKRSNDFAAELLDDFHSPALKKSAAYSALQNGTVNREVQPSYRFTVDIDRSLFERYADPIPAIIWIANVREASLNLVAVVDGATGKLAGIDRKSDLTTDEGSLYIGLRSVAASTWKFRPNVPTRVPFHVQFECRN